MSTIEKAAAKLKIAKNDKLETPQVLPGDDCPEPSFAMRGNCEIDSQKLTEHHMLTPGDGSSTLAKELRRIKRPLFMNINRAEILHGNKKPSNVIMVTSSLPGEGKTYTSINLAISMAAEMDRKVLLIDGDIAKRDLSRFLEIEDRPGLSDLLREQNAVPDNFILSTNVNRLEVLPSGQPSAHIDELFASDTMIDVMNQLASEDETRVIVFDSPPLLVTTEAEVLARRVGQVILVVEANNTPKAAVLESQKRLSEAENVSALLNKAARNTTDNYGYGYEYGTPDQD